MTEEQITALAREYAEEEYKTLNLPTDHTEVSAYRYMDFARFLLRRYCLVEKEVVRTAYQRAIEQGKHAHVKYHVESRAKLRLLESLFPDIAKEVEG